MRALCALTVAVWEGNPSEATRGGERAPAAQAGVVSLAWLGGEKTEGGHVLRSALRSHFLYHRQLQRGNRRHRNRRHSNTVG
eukprot:SAG11_NODE_12897_length_680_cov_1.146299_1_plen_81_part_10